MKRDNYGIQANNVTADVMAVGAGAKASKVIRSSGSQGEIQALISELHERLAQLPLQPAAKESLGEELNALKEAASNSQPQPDRVGGILRNLSGKLKMVGVLLTDSAALAEPIKKIASIFGVPVPW